MKLAIFDQFSDPGGAQQMLLDLLPAIRERGWDAVVGLPGGGPMFARVRDAGFAAERIDVWTPGRIAALAEGVDVIYVNGPRLLPAAALAGLRAPVVFHGHSAPRRAAARAVAGLALRRMGASVIANCEFVASAWRRWVDVRVIYNGVSRGSVSGIERLTEPRPVGSGQAMIACIGRIAPEKGQREFVEAARIVHAAAPEARFAIYGAPMFAAPKYEREVRKRAAGLPVEFAGWAADVYNSLARTAILLVPSSAAEATTRVILEAYAAGVPVVAFRRGGIPEVIEDGRTGFLAGSVEEMARIAIELLRDPECRRAIGDAARDSWARRFTLERYRREVLEALETARRRAAPARPLPPAQGHSRSA